MLEHNQYKLTPGAYQHFKGGIYVVENVVNWEEINGVWTKIQDPWVIYRNLDFQYEMVNGSKTQVIKNYMKRLSEFNGTVEIEGEVLKRFTKL